MITILKQLTKNIFFPCLLLFAVFSSCSEDEILYKDKLAGTWKLGSNSESKKLTFINNNFQYDFKDIQIGGYFYMSGNSMSGTAVIYRGEGATEIYPENFEGELSISGDLVRFKNFSGTWNNVFYDRSQKE